MKSFCSFLLFAFSSVSALKQGFFRKSIVHNDSFPALGSKNREMKASTCSSHCLKNDNCEAFSKRDCVMTEMLGSLVETNPSSKNALEIFERDDPVKCK